MNKRIFFFLTLTLTAHELNLWGMGGSGSGQSATIGSRRVHEASVSSSLGGPRAHSMPVVNSVQRQTGVSQDEQETKRPRGQEEINSAQSPSQDSPRTTANEQQAVSFPSADRSDNLKALARLLYDMDWSPSKKLQVKREIKRLCEQEKINLAQLWPQDADLAKTIEDYTEAQTDREEAFYVKSEQRAYADFINTFEASGIRNTLQNRPLGILCCYPANILDEILDIAIVQQNGNQGAIQNLALGAGDNEVSLLEMACANVNYVVYFVLMTRCSLVATDERFHRVFATILTLLNRYQKAVIGTRQISQKEMECIQGDCLNLKRMIYTLLISTQKDQDQENRKRFIAFLTSPIEGLGKNNTLGQNFFEAYSNVCFADCSKEEQALDAKNMCLICELTDPELFKTVKEIEKLTLNNILRLPAKEVMSRLRNDVPKDQTHTHVVEDYVLPHLHLGMFKAGLDPWDMKNMPYLNVHTCHGFQRESGVCNNQDKNLLELIMCTEADETLRVNPRCCESYHRECFEKGAAADAIRYWVESGVLSPNDEINGETILNMAVRVQAYEVVKALLALRADPDFSGAKPGETPRQRAKRLYGEAEKKLNSEREERSLNGEREKGSQRHKPDYFFGVDPYLVGYCYDADTVNVYLSPDTSESRDTTQWIMELFQKSELRSAETTTTVTASAKSTIGTIFSGEQNGKRDPLEQIILSRVVTLPANEAFQKLSDLARINEKCKKIVETIILPNLLCVVPSTQAANSDGIWITDHPPYLGHATTDVRETRPWYPCDEKDFVDNLSLSSTAPTTSFTKRKQNRRETSLPEFLMAVTEYELLVQSLCDTHYLNRPYEQFKQARGISGYENKLCWKEWTETVEKSMTSKLDYLVKLGVIDQNTRIEGESLLCMAVRVQSLCFVKKLLELGADPNSAVNVAKSELQKKKELLLRYNRPSGYSGFMINVIHGLEEKTIPRAQEILKVLQDDAVEVKGTCANSVQPVTCTTTQNNPQPALI